MKKFFLTMVAAMAFTFSFAETKSYNAEMGAEGIHRSFVDRGSSRFDMSCDMRRLAVVLDLDDRQMDAVETIQQIFNDEMMSIAAKRGHGKRYLVRQAVKKDVRRMQQVLNDKQMDTYMVLLTATLRNKHL